ncbi:MAG: HIT family protein [Pseudomonadales bacterium]|nr:HIT family protein [Pseudomonadales bacterium]
MTHCIFCDIVAEEASASVVYRDERCMAFMDLFPMGEGHVLIIPNEHHVFLDELDDDMRSHLFTVAYKVYSAQKKIGLQVDGTNLVINDGKAAQQTVPHVHIHLVPRTQGDVPKLTLRFLKGLVLKIGLSKIISDESKRKRLDDIALRLSQQLKEG